MRNIMYLQKSLAGIFVISVGHPARVGVTAERKTRYEKGIYAKAKLFQEATFVIIIFTYLN